MNCEDTTKEVDKQLLEDAIRNHGFRCTTEENDILDCNFYIVAVPTPIDEYNRPDLKPLQEASRVVGRVIKKDDIVVYESTVYPGMTEEECIPIVERVSGLKYNVDFYAGYSPERINPGDRNHTVETIKKVTSGSTPEIADIVDGIYNTVLVNGPHKAPSIKVAEASKIIENTQRDVNIAFFNELAKICNVAVQTLRYYDSIGVLKADYVDQVSGYRYYAPEKIQIFQIVSSLKKLNFSLEEIKDFCAYIHKFCL